LGQQFIPVSYEQQLAFDYGWQLRGDNRLARAGCQYKQLMPYT
jgi:hypothetical protein